MGRANMPPVAQGFTETLEQLIEDGNPAGIASYRSLGNRMSEISSRQNAESWLRSVKRYRQKNDVPPEARRIIARALKVPVNIFPPSRERQTVATLNRRLEAAEADVAFLMEWVARGFDSLGVPLALRDEARLASDDDGSP